MCRILYISRNNEISNLLLYQTLNNLLILLQSQSIFHAYIAVNLVAEYRFAYKTNFNEGGMN